MPVMYSSSCFVMPLHDKHVGAAAPHWALANQIHVLFMQQPAASLFVVDRIHSVLELATAAAFNRHQFVPTTQVSLKVVLPARIAIDLKEDFLL